MSIFKENISKEFLIDSRVIIFMVFSVCQYRLLRKDSTGQRCDGKLIQHTCFSVSPKPVPEGK